MVPKLVDYNWRVDIKTNSNLSSSEDSAKSGQQTCILQLKVINKFLLNIIHSHTHFTHSHTNYFDR